MRVNPQSDVGLGVSKALADGHDVNARVNQLAGVGMAPGMERHFRNANLGRRTKGIGGEGGAFNVGKEQVLGLQLSRA